jgi:hypothetical protein
MPSCAGRISCPLLILDLGLVRFLLVILMIVKEASYPSLERRCLLQEEFLKHAAECKLTAKLARDPASKAAWSQMAERWRRGGARPSIFDQPLRFAPRTPCDQIQASSGLSESCPKNADVPKSPFPCSGSPGAVGRHNNTANRVAFGC